MIQSHFEVNMNIKVDVYTKKYGITTIDVDEQMILDCALMEFNDRSAHSNDEITNILIDKVEV